MLRARTLPAIIPPAFNVVQAPMFNRIHNINTNGMSWFTIILFRSFHRTECPICLVRMKYPTFLMGVICFSSWNTKRDNFSNAINFFAKGLARLLLVCLHRVPLVFLFKLMIFKHFVFYFLFENNYLKLIVK